MAQQLRRWVTVALAVAGLTVGACSSSDDDGGESGPRGEAADQCDAMVAKICSKLGPCESLSDAECKSQVNASFQQSYGATCYGADAVGDSYDQCLTDLDSHQCGDSLPASCTGVILFLQ